MLKTSSIIYHLLLTDYLFLTLIYLF